jgi:hypothetical protein
MLMQLTYDKALATIIDHTEIGYTIASQDRLWVVLTFDLDSTDQFKYNRMYSRGIGNGWGYDLTISDVQVWTTRREAEEFAKELRADLADWVALHPDSGHEAPEVYVMNLGDEARYEALIIGRDNGRGTRRTPKFKGSQRAWDAMTEMSRKWYEENA